jgi:hypothetical protein
MLDAGDETRAASALEVDAAQRRHEVVLGSTAGGPAMLDVGKLLSTRLLIQAGSGGGKSWLLRRLLEQTHHMVRQIVFDPEGELMTLAERFDYTVCAPDSEAAPLRPDGGAAAAQTIYRSGRSAILALSEFELEDMHGFVADFCRELLRMPQDCWDHTLLAIDEIQILAPQHDKAESKKPLIDLARRGRKRGLGLVCATQRLSELSKGVAGQLENKLIGLTSLDVDIDRAADVLGMRAVNARSVLRRLEGGHFIAFGPALGYDLAEVSVGPVQTRHGILGAFTGRPQRPSMTHEELVTMLRNEVAPVEPPAQPEPGADARTTRPRRSEVLRQAALEMAARSGAAAAAKHFGIGRSTLYAWMKSTGAQRTRPAKAPAPKGARPKRRRARTSKAAHLNALAPAQKIDRVFEAAVSVLQGESLQAVAARHGRTPPAARHWVNAALAHVNLRRLGVEVDGLHLEQLRPHAKVILPALKRAHARSRGKHAGAARP